MFTARIYLIASVSLLVAMESHAACIGAPEVCDVVAGIAKDLQATQGRAPNAADAAAQSQMTVPKSGQAEQRGASVQTATGMTNDAFDAVSLAKKMFGGEEPYGGAALGAVSAASDWKAGKNGKMIEDMPTPPVPGVKAVTKCVGAIVSYAESCQDASADQQAQTEEAMRASTICGGALIGCALGGPLGADAGAMVGGVVVSTVEVGKMQQAQEQRRSMDNGPSQATIGPYPPPPAFALDQMKAVNQYLNQQFPASAPIAPHKCPADLPDMLFSNGHYICTNIYHKKQIVPPNVTITHNYDTQTKSHVVPVQPQSVPAAPNPRTKTQPTTNVPCVPSCACPQPGAAGVC